jgi:hypothetical protein
MYDLNEPLPPTRCLEVGDFSMNMLKQDRGGILKTFDTQHKRVVKNQYKELVL